MKIGILTPEVPGHLNPVTTLGKELEQRGHDVTFVGTRMARTIVARAGLKHVVLGEDDPLNDQQDEVFRELAKHVGLKTMLLTGKSFGIQTQLILKYLPDVLDRENFDGLLIDQCAPGPCNLAEQRGIPYAVVCNALAMYVDPYTPPPPLPWGYRRDWVGFIRNKLAIWSLLPVYRFLSQESKTKVDPLKLVMNQECGLVHLAQQPPFFDFPREKPVPKLHCTAPWHRSGRDDTTCDFPWDWLDGRPLIYASMGTLQNALGHVFTMIIEACRDLPMQLVLSKGGGEVSVQGELPDNVMLVDRAPQLRILEKAALMITHAGLNSTLECIAHGVPMLCLPVTNDQPGVAKRVEWLGMGRVIPVARVSTKRIKKELDHLLGDPEFQKRMSGFQQQLDRMDGPAEAATLIERAFLTGEPILRAESVAAS